MDGTANVKELVMAAKCGFCGSFYSDARLVGVTIGRKWNGVAACCPSCSATLSAVIDPVALKTDIVNAVTKAIKQEARYHPSCSAEDVVRGVVKKLEKLLVQQK